MAIHVYTVMNHTTPSAFGCVPLGIQSVDYSSDFAFLSHCSPVSLGAQLGLLDCERCRWRGHGRFSCDVVTETTRSTLLEGCSIVYVLMT